MSFSSSAETLKDMGSLCSTPSSKCCKREWPFTPFGRHNGGCKRIKYTLVPQRDPERQRRREAALTNSGSPNTLHRSNAIRRPGHSRSQSSSPPFAPHPSRLQIRNMTPPPIRPTSIVPTLMLVGTPSTGPPTSVSRSSRTAATNTTSPTSPTTAISSSYGYSSSSSANNGRPRTVYMVDGEVVGGDEERLELRWIDALRAPGAPGGYRTVVDVVEERRSGRLTVVNGGGRGSEESVRPCRSHLAGGFGGDSVDGIFAPKEGRQSHRGRLEEQLRLHRQVQPQQQQQRKLRQTPMKRKPVPARMKTTDEESPLAFKSHAPITSLDSITLEDDAPATPDIDDVVPQKFRWRRGPMSRPPIPSFRRVSVTEKELLDEVEDARRILEKKDLKVAEEKNGRENEERKKEAEEEKGKEVKDGEMEDGKGKEKEKEKEDDKEGTMDFFWVDNEGHFKYRRCGLPL
ncbi:MAG: hypothetical protein Q9209_003461 [Squamulea sp. 1 TL-2023]